MADLEKAIARVRTRIEKHGQSRSMNEQSTKSALIEPILRALGWDVEDVEEAEGEALSGAMWYNNDGLAVFPRVLIASGAADQPASAEDCVTVGEAVAGISSGWSAVELSEPVTSDRGGFYLLFQFPQASVQTGTGAGGGAVSLLKTPSTAQFRSAFSLTTAFTVDYNKIRAPRGALPIELM